MSPKNYKAEAVDNVKEKIKIWNMFLNEIADDNNDDRLIKEYILRKIDTLKKSLEVLLLI
ncbi:hypothetical protein [Flavobacterium litorale]|uniref:Uncharacterized protein n=1 Tax=Flavobacterium litorale TaxID=2856519 RepID=A0ABX8V513_9FLAO|nr:hypothetical protein [Flavobacterium litorale]QYJ67927.1 hypothetical protein K1I41_10325 [Flavobacterium litorale]